MADERLVRISTAGSVDDGKSTLIGRLLFDSHAILDDQYAAIERSSSLTGESGVNLALLTDGLRAEREQKITIDVAYRYFATPKRRFIIADTPGHAQYTRNMVTGASRADVAVLLVDVRQGMTAQSKRHAFIASLLRVPHVVVAVNKMDLVGFDESRFQTVVAEFLAFAERLQLNDLTFIPISALEGDNIVNRSQKTPWHSGPSVLEFLENVHVSGRVNQVDFRLPIQCVIRPDHSFRGFAGQVASGKIRVGEEVMVLPSGIRTKIREIAAPEGAATIATTEQSVVVRLTDEVDLSRGDMLVRPRNPAETTTAFEAMICWMADAPLSVNAPCVLMHTTREVTAQIRQVLYRLNVETASREDDALIGLNDIARVVVTTAKPIFADPYERNRATGSFVLVDPHSNQVLAAGMITRTSTTLLDAPTLGGRVVWLTGLSGAGKSTLSDAVASALRAAHIPVLQLDGDTLRAGLNADLGFSPEGRTENIRRAAEIAQIASSQGLIVLCSFISPEQAQRDNARRIIGADFLEVHVKCDVDTCAARDPKGLYAQAKSGDVTNFTGITASYEEPANADLIIDTSSLTQSEAAQALLDAVRKR